MLMTELRMNYNNEIFEINNIYIILITCCMHWCVRARACTYRKMLHKYYMFQITDKWNVKVYVMT